MRQERQEQSVETFQSKQKEFELNAENKREPGRREATRVPPMEC